MTLHFPLSKENCMRLDLPNLLINIWEYNDEKHIVVNCEICRKYEEWCIEAARSSGNLNLKALPLSSLKYKYKTKNFLTLEI